MRDFCLLLLMFHWLGDMAITIMRSSLRADCEDMRGVLVGAHCLKKEALHP